MVNRLLKPAATSVRTPAGIILISSVLVAHATTVIAALQGWAVVYYVAALASLYADVARPAVRWPCAPSSAGPSSATSTAPSSASCPWSSSCCGSRH